MSTSDDCKLAASGAGPSRIMRVEELEAPFTLAESERDAYFRRFSTLFVDEHRSRRGGLGRVYHATNVLGEQLAVKKLLLPEGNEGGPDEESLRAAFRREFESHRVLSALRGFPRLFGFGSNEGVPVIVMEWIEGMTLAEARRDLAVDDEGRVSPLTVARVGRDLFELVSRLSLVGEGLVHRDISPANVIIRTTHRTLEAQRAEGTFDLCLVDFGSAEPVSMTDGSFTATNGTLRHATVDYAPPEMLSDDIPSVGRRRHSPAVDVYAVGSVLCHLIGGRPPFPGATRTASPYRLKTENEPERPIPAHVAAGDLAAVLSREGEASVIVAPIALERDLSPRNVELGRALALADEQIVDAIMACLASDQKRRPAPTVMRDELDGLASRYGENVRRALSGDSLTPCMTGTSWLAVESPLSARRVLRRGGRIVGMLVWTVTSLMTALLVGEGDLTRAALVGVLLMTPALLALLARWRDTSTGSGFVRGSAALLFSSAASALALWRLFGLGDRLSGTLAAELLCASAMWLPLVTDYVCACVPGVIRERRRRLPEGTGLAPR